MKKPTLYKGTFRGTDGNGNDWYGASYYSVEEVKQYIKDVKVMKKDAKVKRLRLTDEKHSSKLWKDRTIKANETIAILKAQLEDARVNSSGIWRHSAEYQSMKAQLAEFQKLVDETKEGELAFTSEDLRSILEKK